MKKIIVGALALLAAVALAWVGLAWHTGGEVEQRTQVLLEQANQLLAQRSSLAKVRLERSSYEKSLFSSQMRHVLVLDWGEAPGFMKDLPQVRVEFDTRIDHGPFPAAARARGMYAPQMAAMHTELVNGQNVAFLFELTGGAPPLVADDVLGYDGVLHSHVKIPPVNITEDGETLSFSGMDMQATLPLSVPGAFRARANVAEVSFGGEDRQVKVSGIQMEGDQTPDALGMFTGDASLKVQRVEASAGEAGNVVLDGLEFTSVTREDGGMLSFDFAWLLGGVRVGEADLGSGEMRFGLANVDGKILLELKDALEQAQRNMLEQQNPRSMVDALPPVLTIVGRLLAAKPTVEIDPLRWKTAAGESKLQWKMGLTATEQLQQMLERADIAPGGDWVLQALDTMELDVRLSKPMMIELLTWQGMQDGGMERAGALEAAEEQVRSMAAAAEIMDLGRSQGDELVGSFRYAEGQAQLNGRTVPLQDLLRGLGPR